MSGGMLFEEGRIGALSIRNRIVRAGTSETMATDRGEATDELCSLYETLARHQVGLLFTGHLYCSTRGQYARRQTGIYDDSLIAGLRRLTRAVHRHETPIFAQLAHAGSQSRVQGGDPLAPSAVPNALTGREVREAREDEIGQAIAAFAHAAGRAVDAGFDGIHIHAANGYLISEFSSPATNRRTDGWGGSPERRDRFAAEVVRAVRATVGAGVPVTLKLGMVDAIEGGLQLEESVRRARALVDAGLDGIEVSCGIMDLATDSARQYVAVDRRRALQDLLVHRLLSEPAAEAYFVPWATALRADVNTTIIVVGGMRTAGTIEAVLRSGDADFVALARPLIREPDLVSQLAAGRTSAFDCTSCNICLMHEGQHSLRCWRTPRHRLLAHAAFRLSGGFKR
jgi:2,4-dienoyl-CoA reductase-like NADH-dependent reductase (Old Yellow Enzyme family)